MFLFLCHFVPCITWTFDADVDADVDTCSVVDYL